MVGVYRRTHAGLVSRTSDVRVRFMNNVIPESAVAGARVLPTTFVAMVDGRYGPGGVDL